MNYEFPIINTIDDVLPAIVGRDEFIVAERDGFTVINYMVAFEDTFPPIKVAGGSAKMRAERSLHNTIRRECRGLIFYPDGRIMSRPFDKWFNVGEREETLAQNIEFNNVSHILVKLDGSMLRPLDIHGDIKWGTKMGVTDVAKPVDDFCQRNPQYNEFASWAMRNGLTPIFEWCSPNNRIVIKYDQESLTLLALRDNVTGKYLDLH